MTLVLECGHESHAVTGEERRVPCFACQAVRTVEAVQGWLPVIGGAF